MDAIYLELRPANKKCCANFIEISKVEYNHSPIFEYALRYANDSSSFKRTGKKLSLAEISEDHMTVKLTSEAPLQMASKSLAGFTRKLLSIDEELGNEIFKDLTYNNTLFRNREVPPIKEPFVMEEEMSDTAALKLCVDVFCNDITTTKEERKYNENINRQIKLLLAEYSRQKRLAAYAKGLYKLHKEGADNE